MAVQIFKDPLCRRTKIQVIFFSLKVVSENASLSGIWYITKLDLNALILNKVLIKMNSNNQRSLNAVTAQNFKNPSCTCTRIKTRVTFSLKVILRKYNSEIFRIGPKLDLSHPFWKKNRIQIKSNNQRGLNGVDVQNFKDLQSTRLKIRVFFFFKSHLEKTPHSSIWHRTKAWFEHTHFEYSSNQN